MNSVSFDKVTCYQSSLELTSQFCNPEFNSTFNCEFDSQFNDCEVLYSDEGIIDALSNRDCPIENIIINARFLGTQFSYTQMKQLFNRITENISIDEINSLEHIINYSVLTQEQKRQYRGIIESWMTMCYTDRKIQSRL